MQNIITGLLQWCKALEIPVVMLSATLPPTKKRELLSIYTEEELSEDYPVISAVNRSGKLKMIPFSKVAKRQTFLIQLLPLLHQPEKIAGTVLQAVSEGGCACILLNTVMQTQEVYRAIKKISYDGRLLLFHAQFPMERRDQIEKTCIQLFGKNKEMRPKKAILVASQVVEQSLDLDFDYFYSAIAPIDLLLQRMGREFRHENTPRPQKLLQPTFSVFVPETDAYGVDAVVYPECLLRQSVTLLKERKTVSIPEDMQPLVAQGYDARFAPQEEMDKWMEHLVEEQISASMAEKYKLGSPEKKFRPLCDTIDFDDLEQQNYLSVQTRLSEPHVRIALLKPELYRKVSALQVHGEVEITDKHLAQEVLAQSVSVRKKKCERYGSRFSESAILGKRLLANVTMLPAENPCIAFDEELGVLWKEENECM